MIKWFNKESFFKNVDYCHCMHLVCFFQRHLGLQETQIHNEKKNEKTW